MGSLTGQLLVSVPGLSDPNFFRSVVLMLRHDSGSAAGLILNRPTSWGLECAVDGITPEEIAEGTAGDSLARNLFWGGPVEGPLMALHGSLMLAEMNVLPGVDFVVDMARVRLLVAQRRHPFRLYTGYCGWGPGQLEQELAAGGWLVCPADANHVFSPDPGCLWNRLCESIGQSILFAGRDPGAPLPGGFDPGLN